MAETILSSEIDLRREQIMAFASDADLPRATTRLLDFAKDFGTRDTVNEAVIIKSRLAMLQRESRLGPTERTRADHVRLVDEVLQLVEAICRQCVGRVTPDMPSLQATSPEDFGNRNASLRPNFNAAFDAFRKRRKEILANSREAAFTGTGLVRDYRRGSGFCLRGVSLALRPGEITGVVGVNGAGKTTLLRIVAGELQPDDGVGIYPLLDSGVTDPRQLHWAKIRHQIAYVPQRPDRWFGRLQENLHWQAALHGVFSQENCDLVEFVIMRLGLERYRAACWKELPGGHRMRFELAKALISRPRLLVLDEPLAPLDIISQQHFLQDIRDLADSSGDPLPIILSSQNLYELESVADQIILLGDGDVLYAGPTELIGQDRTENTFELRCNLTASELAAILGACAARCTQVTLAGTIVRAPRTTEAHNVLSVLVKHGVKVTYFRDVSRSSRILFAEGA